MSMGVYIKGMEMPKEGNWITLRIFPDGQCFLYDWCGNDFDFKEHLTAVPVPPHGRLIDADAVFDNLERTGWYDNADRDIAEDLVLDAPTVIPASKGE